jgi:C_GCAxxG_C_C family probable redox protein
MRNKAKTIFGSGFNCAQAVLLSQCEDLGIDKETAAKISCGFGGGMGNSGETCGAVSGAIMLLGLKNGQYREDDSDAKLATYEIVKEFNDKFRAKHGSLRCNDLTGYNLTIPDEKEKAKEAGVFSNVCPNLVGDAAEIVAEML